MKKLLPILTLFLAPVLASAGSANVNCRGNYQGMLIEANVHVDEITDFNSGSGTLYINGRPAANFVGSEVNVNLFFLSIHGQNQDGASFAAHVTNLNQGQGILDNLQVPAYGLSVQRLPVTCAVR